MKIIGRYILRSISVPFIFGTLTIIFLFLFQFIVNYLNKFLGKGLSYWIILQLIGYNISWMLVLAVPIGILFATLMSFGNLAASHEITVMKAGGTSLIKMMLPVILLGIILTVVLFWFNDKVLPVSNHKAKTLLSDVTRKKPTFQIESGQFTTAIEGYTILARGLDSITGVLKAVTIYDDTRGQQVNIITADTGVIEFSGDYSKMIIYLTNGEIHQDYPNLTKDYRKINFHQYQIIINANGFAFERSNEGMVSKGDREMSISEMTKIVNDAEKVANESKTKYKKELKEHLDFLIGIPPKGAEKIISKGPNMKWLPALQAAETRMNFFVSSTSSDLNQYNDYTLRAGTLKVEIYKKYAIPFACFLFVIIGCPLGIITKGGSFGISAGISLGFYLFYWICLIGGEKLADRGIISPWLGMWAGNIIIGILGILIMLRVHNESFTIFKRRNVPLSAFLKKIPL